MRVGRAPTPSAGLIDRPSLTTTAKGGQRTRAATTAASRYRDASALGAWTRAAWCCGCGSTRPGPADGPDGPDGPEQQGGQWRLVAAGGGWKPARSSPAPLPGCSTGGPIRRRRTASSPGSSKPAAGRGRCSSALRAGGGCRPIQSRPRYRAVSRCCHAAGWGSAPSAGWAAGGAPARTTRTCRSPRRASSSW
jgi:hypothetical protein